MSILSRTLALAAALTLVACGGGTKQQDTKPIADVKAEVAVELGEFTLFDGDEPIAKVHADGSTELSNNQDGTVTWKKGPTIQQDGTVLFNGNAVAKINADGTILDLESKQNLPVTITPDRITVTGDKQTALELSAEGNITVIGEEAKKPARIEGAKTPGQRRTVLAFVALMLGGPRTPGGGDAPPTEGGEPPATPPATPPG